MTGTLNDMDVAQLRDLAQRAEATAKQKEQAARKAEKDIIPPPGTFWRYNKRVWTAVSGKKEHFNILLSADENGGDVRYWFFDGRYKTFSALKEKVSYCIKEWKAGGHPWSDLRISHSRNDTSLQAAVGKLILTARDIK